MEKYLRPGRFSTDPTVGAEIEWIHWRNTFENFFEAIQPLHSFCRSQENIKLTDSIKLRIFMNHVTPNVYKLFSGIETCEEVITHLNNIYSRCGNDISARYKLSNKKQQAGESLYAYVQSLRELANDCNFDVVCVERNREDYIRDVFISGIVSDEIRKKLLENSTLTLEEAVNQAAALVLELQSSNTAELPSNSQEPENNTNSTIQEPQIGLSSGGLTKSDVVTSENLSRICQGLDNVKNSTMDKPESLAEELPGNSAESSVFLPPRGDEHFQQELEELPSPDEIVEGFKSNDAAVLLKMARAARRIIKADVITPLLRALDRDDCSDLQIEAVCALAEIADASCKRAMVVIASGVVTKLVSLASAGGTVGEHCILALGKIAEAAPESRDTVLSSGAVPAIIESLRSGVAISQLRAATWTFHILCGSFTYYSINFDLVKPALPHIANLLEVEDVDILSNLCSALESLTEGQNKRIEAVQAEPDLLKKLLHLLDHPALEVKTQALRVVENMLAGSSEQIDRCLDEGCLHYLSDCLRHSESDVVEKAAFALHNILNGTQPQIQRVIDHGILSHLLQVLKHHDSRCQKEAARAVATLCFGVSPQQLVALLALDFLEPYCDLLGSQDTQTIKFVLYGIAKLLQSAKNRGNVEPLCAKLETIGALDRIKSLQTHENHETRNQVLHILKLYFAKS